MNRKVLALGRMKAGQMNRTEAAYAAYLERQKQIGEIAWYRFESIKLKVADNRCWYAPDFVVMKSTGEIQLHEVKGSKAIFQDDARVKCKVVSDEYPFRLFICYPKKGDWLLEEL